MKTHCPHGHALVPTNVYRNVRGARECRTCKRSRSHTARDALAPYAARRRACIALGHTFVMIKPSGGTRAHKICSECRKAREKRKYQTQRLKPTTPGILWSNLIGLCRRGPRGRTPLPCDITLDAFTKLRAQLCHYCDGALPLKGIGLDRIDPVGGYTLANVVACCAMCNAARGAYITSEEFKFIMDARKRRIGPFGDLWTDSQRNAVSHKARLR